MLGTLDRLENVVSVDRPAIPARLDGRDTPNIAGAAELLATGAAALDAVGACHGELNVACGVDRSGSRIPLIPRLRGGRDFGDSFLELGRLSRASVEKGDILDESDRGVLPRTPVLRSRLPAATIESRLVEDSASRGGGGSTLVRFSAPTLLWLVGWGGWGGGGGWGVGAPR